MKVFVVCTILALLSCSAVTQGPITVINSQDETELGKAVTIPNFPDVTELAMTIPNFLDVTELAITVSGRPCTGMEGGC